MRAVLFACLTSLSLLSQAQTPPTPTPVLAHVGQAQGKYVFCYAQPKAAYDVVFSFGTTYRPTEAMTLNTLIDASLASAQLEAGAQLKAYDAIIIQAGARDVAIKFRDGVPADERDVATVARVQGKPVFIFAEPVAPYQVIGKEKVSWYNHAFGGEYYTIGRAEQNLLKTADKKFPDTQAVIFGESASYVVFTK